MTARAELKNLNSDMATDDIKDPVSEENQNSNAAEEPAEATNEAAQESTEAADEKEPSEKAASEAAASEAAASEEKVEIDPLVSLQAQLDEQKEKYLRLYSDFENLRRRTAKEKLDLIKTASEKLMVELIPVIDDFERALKAFNESKDKDANSLKEGVDLIHNKFNKVLKEKGLKEMEVGQGSAFDTELHEAITQVLAPSEELKGKVVDVIEKGYLLEDKVIRYAKVVTGA